VDTELRKALGFGRKESEPAAAPPPVEAAKPAAASAARSR
jgi:hypothetical protein